MREGLHTGRSRLTWRLAATILVAVCSIGMSGCGSDDPVPSGGGTITTVVVTPPILGSDSCVAPPALALANGTATVTSVLPEQTDDGVGALCGATTPQVDVFYLVQLLGDVNLSLVLSSDSPVQAAIFSDTCPPTQVLGGCGTTASLDVTAGTYLIAVAGEADAAYTLSVGATVVPTPTPTGTCSLPVPITLANGVNLLTGSFTSAEDLSDGTCSSFEVELVHEFTLTNPADIRINKNLPGSDYTAVYLRVTDCIGPESACANAFDNELFIPNLAAGTYFLFVEDSRFSSTDTFLIQIELLPPTPRPGNDNCAGALPLTFSGDVAAATGTFVSAEPDGFLGCQGSRALYYSFTLAVPSIVRLDVDLFNAPAQLLMGSCGSLTVVSCGRSRRWCTQTLAPGSYFVRVRDPGFVSDTPVMLTVTRSDPPSVPANDLCAAATTVTLNSGSAMLQGTLTAATDADYFGGTACATGVIPGQEVFYTLNLPQTSDVTLSVDGSNYFYMQLAVASGSCGSLSTRRCKSRPRAFDPMRLYNVPPGDLILAVEYFRTFSIFDGCVAPTTNAFALAVDVVPSPPTPSNDSCAAPSTLTFPGGIGSAVSAAGTTRGAMDDFSMISCPGISSPISTPGQDVVYALTLSQSAILRVTPTVTFNNMFLYLVPETCGGAAAITCSATTGNPQLDTGFALPPATYYLVVDQRSQFSGDPVPGDFSAVLELIAP